MNRCCTHCKEEFSFMALHSSAGTITKCSGCIMYEEYLLLKKELPWLKELLEISENRVIYEKYSNPEAYEEIQERRKSYIKSVQRIEWLEKTYHNYMTDQNPEWILKRRRVEVMVLGK